MSSTSVDSSPNTSHVQPSERPLIVAAYHYGAPYRKRRVKVPPNINWKDFLGLLYSRLNISPDFDVEIYDEKGIEIVSVEDLVENLSCLPYTWQFPPPVETACSPTIHSIN